MRGMQHSHKHDDYTGGVGMETLAYFLRYLIPSIVALIAVLLLALFNNLVGPVIWSGRLVDRMEVLSYSILIAGPIAYAICFLISFFGIELLKESWPYAKAVFTISCILAIIGIVADILFLPKMR